MEVAVFKINDSGSIYKSRIDFLPESDISIIDFIDKEQSKLCESQWNGGLWKVDEINKTVHILTEWVSQQSTQPSQDILGKDGKFFLDLDDQISKFKSSRREERLNKILNK